MPDFRLVTETVGMDCSKEQLIRAISRYGWAQSFCKNKDVLEVACGTGQGLHMLMMASKSLRACDISSEMVEEAKKNYPELKNIYVSCETKLPAKDKTMDIVICYEAIYYFKNHKKFFSETKRVLKRNGLLILSFPNCELFDFNPSPFAERYFKPRDLKLELENHGFRTEFFGGTALSLIGWRQKVFRPIKSVASRLKIIPGSMSGKAFLKRLVFGKLYRMPVRLDFNSELYDIPKKIHDLNSPLAFKVIYCKAQL